MEMTFKELCVISPREVREGDVLGKRNSVFTDGVTFGFLGIRNQFVQRLNKNTQPFLTTNSWILYSRNSK